MVIFKIILKLRKIVEQNTKYSGLTQLLKSDLEFQNFEYHRFHSSMELDSKASLVCHFPYLETNHLD